MRGRLVRRIPSSFLCDATGWDRKYIAKMFQRAMERTSACAAGGSCLCCLVVLLFLIPFCCRSWVRQEPAVQYAHRYTTTLTEPYLSIDGTYKMIKNIVGHPAGTGK